MEMRTKAWTENLAPGNPILTAGEFRDTKTLGIRWTSSVSF